MVRSQAISGSVDTEHFVDGFAANGTLAGHLVNVETAFVAGAHVLAAEEDAVGLNLETDAALVVLVLSGRVLFERFARVQPFDFFYRSLSGSGGFGGRFRLVDLMLSCCESSSGSGSA